MLPALLQSVYFPRERVSPAPAARAVFFNPFCVRLVVRIGRLGPCVSSVAVQASEFEVKWRQSSRLVQQLRQVRDRLLMAEEQWKEQAEKDRERMMKIFQEAAAGGDGNTSRTNASSARSAVSSADSAVASANERIHFIQKEREAARLHAALAAAQAHIKELEGFIDEM